MNLTLLDLAARQEELYREISSLRWRVFKNLSTAAEAKLLRQLEAEFAENNVKLQRHKNRGIRK